MADTIRAPSTAKDTGCKQGGREKESPAPQTTDFLPLMVYSNTFPGPPDLHLNPDSCENTRVDMFNH